MNAVVHLPPSHAHFGTFDEVAETVRYGLKTLAATNLILPDRTIVVGAHLLPWSRQTDDRLILYNFEQREAPTLNTSVLDLFQRHEVWDYSPANVAWLATRGVRAKYVPIGYVPELRRIEKAAAPDIDVLFYGLVNARRRRILDGLRAAGLVVHEVVNCYGGIRDHLIARSKVVLNMHFYDAGIFEMVRCSYLFANAVCVVSEESVDIPPELVHQLSFVPYDRLVDACVHVVRNCTDEEKRTLAARAHIAFRECNEAEILREAIYGPRP